MAIIPWSGSDNSGNILSGHLPVIDVCETGDSIIVNIRLAGMDPGDIDISVSSGFLKIKGVSTEKEEKQGKGHWKKEIHKESFERVIKLPIDVNEDEIEATADKGSIRIIVPKSEKGVRAEKKIIVKETDKIKSK
jgi:HSP20 family protein